MMVPGCHLSRQAQHRLEEHSTQICCFNVPHKIELDGGNASQRKITLSNGARLKALKAGPVLRCGSLSRM